MTRAHRWMICTLLILNAFNLAYIFWRTRVSRTATSSRVTRYTYRGHDFPRVLPLPHELERVLWTTEESAHYAPLGDASYAQWLALTSAGGGTARLGPADRAFVPTMFHELHCLWIVNRAFSKGARAVPLWHVQHCLNYVRQGVLCAPDLTLERGDFERRDFGRETGGGTHVCRDWEAVYRFMDGNFREWSERTGWAFSVSPIGPDLPAPS